VTDFVEMFRHWNAGRSQVQIHQALNIDRKTIRKYLAPALAIITSVTHCSPDGLAQVSHQIARQHHYGVRAQSHALLVN
jgi:hypothetical protein